MAVSLCLCLISGIFACQVQSSFGSVTVEDFKVIVDDGRYVNGQIYIPKNASPDNKLPLIVLSHGSYNNLEHQDQNMIELSRRGFVVISNDAYGHGSSSVIPGGIDVTNMQHVIDYACSSYTFIDTSRIGVSGHSMGGQIASATVQHYFEQAARGESENLVSAICTVGYDPQYTPYEFEGVSEPVENHKIYTGTINGEEYIRVINQNTEIHPLNHFSSASCRDMINFFYEVFGVPAGYERIDASNQIWQWKEFFNLVGLVGIFLFLFPFASMMIHGTRFFAELARPEPAPAPALNSPKSKAKYWIVYALNTILPALLVVPVAYKLVGKESFVPFTHNSWFGEPNTNELAAWTLVCGLVLLAVFVAAYLLTRGDEKGIPEYWGVRASGRVIWKSVLLAALTVAVAYVILFFNDLLFNTDYRIWVIDMRVFNLQKLLFFVAYVPAWIVFYLVNSLLVNGGNRVAGRPEWQTMLISCIGNIAGIAVLIFIQYQGIIASGVFRYNSMRIVNLFPLIFMIPAGTLVSRRFFKETGNIYAGSLVIAFLYTMMTVANTMVLGTVL